MDTCIIQQPSSLDEVHVSHRVKSLQQVQENTSRLGVKGMVCKRGHHHRYFVSCMDVPGSNSIPFMLAPIKKNIQKNRRRICVCVLVES